MQKTSELDVWHSNSFSCASCEVSLQKGKRKHQLSKMDNTVSSHEAISFKLPVNKKKVRSSVSKTSQFWTDVDMKLQRFQDAVTEAVKRREQVQGDKTEIVMEPGGPELSNEGIVNRMEYKAKSGSNRVRRRSRKRSTKRDKILEHTIASSPVVSEKPEDISDHAITSYPFTDDKGR